MVISLLSGLALMFSPAVVNAPAVQLEPVVTSSVSADALTILVFAPNGDLIDNITVLVVDCVTSGGGSVTNCTY